LSIEAFEKVDTLLLSLVNYQSKIVKFCSDFQDTIKYYALGNCGCGYVEYGCLPVLSTFALSI